MFIGQMGLLGAAFGCENEGTVVISRAVSGYSLLSGGRGECWCIKLMRLKVISLLLERILLRTIAVL